jgi:hypothetical protein
MISAMLFTIPECHALLGSGTNPQLRAVLTSAALQFAGTPGMQCIHCNELLRSTPAYVSVMGVLEDEPAPHGLVAVVCSQCGANNSRTDLTRHVESVARLMCGEVAGHG